LELVWDATGQKPKELDECEIPDEAMHIWEWFHEVHSARTSNGFGPNPIGYAEIAAWSKLSGIRPNMHEVKMLRELDRVYLEVDAKNAAKRGKK
jgi:hypothetical protein